MKALCYAGAGASFLLLAYCVETMGQLVLLGGPPQTAVEAFRLLEANRLTGLLRLDLPTLLALPLYYALFLGLFGALRREAPVLTPAATVLAFAGVTLILTTPWPLSMLSLSGQYSAAASEEVRRQIEAAGEAWLASDLWHGTRATAGGMLLQAGTVLISVAMLRGKAFRRAVAYLGIATHGLDLVHIPLALMAPLAGAVLMAVAGTLYPFWFFLAGRGLLQAGCGQRTTTD